MKEKLLLLKDLLKNKIKRTKSKEQIKRTLKNKINKYMTSISKNVYINKLGDIINEYNNTFHSTVKMKPVDVENTDEYPEFEVDKIRKLTTTQKM